MVNTRNGNNNVTFLPLEIVGNERIVVPAIEISDAGPAAASNGAAGAAAASRAAAGAAAASRAAAGAAAGPRAAAPAVDLRGAAAAPAANDDGEVVGFDDILKSFKARAVHNRAEEKRQREEDEEQLRLKRVKYQELLQKATTELQENESVLAEVEILYKTLKEETSTSREVLEMVKSKAPPPSQAEIDRVQGDQNIANWSKEQEKSGDDRPKQDEAGPNAVLNGGLLMAGNAVVGAGDLLRQASESVTLRTVVGVVAGSLFLNRVFR